MEYRNFGKLDWKVSVLGFGAMRLPTTDGDPNSGRIDEPQAMRMMHHAIEQGVNYIDTAYIYHAGASEGFVGRVLDNGYRDKVRVATKSPVWLIQSPGDFDRLLNEQLRRLRTDCIDFYLLHALDQKSWPGTILKHNVIEKANAAVRDGRIRHLGFSFHDGYDTFAEILNGYDGWEFCQIQYNYLDTENQAGAKGLKLASSRGLAVVIMEPLLGGRLANPPAAVRDFLSTGATQRTPVDWALQWIWDQPEVSVVLSGMSNMEQVKLNLASASSSRVNSFGVADFEVVDRLRSEYLKRTTIPCTKCNYCMPCPSGVNIPRNFELYNDAYTHQDLPGARITYKFFFSQAEHASECTECRTCEDLCPQKIPITDWMPKVAAALG